MKDLLHRSVQAMVRRAGAWLRKRPSVVGQAPVRREAATLTEFQAELRLAETALKRAIAKDLHWDQGYWIGYVEGLVKGVAIARREESRAPNA